MIKPTVGVEFTTKDIIINGKIIKLQIWDRSGKEECASIVKTYIPNTNIFIFMFDLSDVNSFEQVKKLIKSAVETLKDTHPHTILIGNKCDLDQVVP